MARLSLCALLLAIMTGCTSTRLRNSMISQGDTLTELQYKQVLGNLARLSEDTWALPAQVVMRDGSAQIQDFGQINAGVDNHGHGWIGHEFLTGSRTVVEQWSVRPISDDNVLKLLRLAYQRALGIEVSLVIEDGYANDLAHDLKKQIAWPDAPEISTDKKVEELARRLVEAEYKKRITENQQASSESSQIKNEYDRAMKYILSSASEEIITESDLAAGLSHLDPDLMSPAGGKVLPQPLPNSSTASDEKTSVDNIKIVTPSAREVRRQIKKVEDDLLKIRGGWVHIGPKAPKNAKYVGKHNNTYAWICEDGCRDLAELTLTVLNFSPHQRKHHHHGPRRTALHP